VHPEKAGGVSKRDQRKHYYRARYYDPSTGRFISEDPIGFKGGFDFYVYALNAPTRFRDPSGFAPDTASIVVGLVGQLGNIFPGSTIIHGPNGAPLGLIVPVPCWKAFTTLVNQGYETGLFLPYNNPLDHPNGWEFRTHGVGFHFRLRYPPELRFPPAQGRRELP
jgi:RHS repeat-associated protein